MAGQDTTSSKQKTCFVIMGFGEKTDYQTGRLLDLNKSYKNIIKPAVEAAGLKCVRADEILHSGVIDVPMYEQLLKADVVVADLSTSNSNAIYELGVRHALRPYTTITIAEKELKYPFDVNHIAIRSYEHLGKDIGYDEAKRMQVELQDAIQSILVEPRADSPVYTFIRDLTPPEIRRAAESMARGAIAIETQSPAPPSTNTDRLGFLVEQATEAKKDEDWVTARAMFASARKLLKDPTGVRGEDPYIVQQLALATYKGKQPNPISALHEARELLLTLNPSTTHDPETLGLLGGVWKRLYELNMAETSCLNEAISCYERGFYLKNDYYNGINLAYLLNVRANISSGEEAITDCVLARRVRSKVATICEELKADKVPDSEKYWVAATLEEACFGLGNTTKYEEAKANATALAHQSWMRGTTEEQIAKLAKLLKSAPCS